MINGHNNGYDPDLVYPPGETLLELLEEHEMTQAELAERMEQPLDEIEQLIDGHTPLTLEIATQLEAIFLMPAKLWLNLEGMYRSQQPLILVPV